MTNNTPTLNGIIGRTNEIVRLFLFVASVTSARHSSHLANCHWFTDKDLDTYRRIDTRV